MVTAHPHRICMAVLILLQPFLGPGEQTSLPWLLPGQGGGGGKADQAWGHPVQYEAEQAAGHLQVEGGGQDRGAGGGQDRGAGGGQGQHPANVDSKSEL
jgi:hypothetical protein